MEQYPDNLLRTIDVDISYDRLLATISSLPERYKAALQLRFQQSLSYDEIAKEVGAKSRQSAYQLVQTAVMKLKASLPSRTAKVSAPGHEITCPPNTRLQDYLLSKGIHILTACGGRGNCGKCTVRVVRGEAAINTMDRIWFSNEQLKAGWRLGCQVFTKNEEITVEVKEK